MDKIKYTSLLLVSLFLFSCTHLDTHETNIDPISETYTQSQTPIQTSLTTPSNRLDKYQIQTTFVPQAPEKNWDQPWQDACEEAALLTLYYYHQQISPDINQIKKDLLFILDYQQKIDLDHDINMSQIGQIAKDLYQIEFEIIDNPTALDIENLILSNKPVLITAAGKKLYKENRHFRNGGPEYHALAILGFDSLAQIFTVHDVGTQHGAYFKYTYATLLDAIADLPDTGKKNIDQGAKRVLVLLNQ